MIGPISHAERFGAEVPSTNTAAAKPNESRSDWVDRDTGHRVIRLSDQPGSSSLYFHQNSFTPEGDKLIFNTRQGIAAVDLRSLGRQRPTVDLDNKWVVFRSNLSGPSHVYAVEIAQSSTGAPAK